MKDGTAAGTIPSVHWIRYYRHDNSLSEWHSARLEGAIVTTVCGLATRSARVGPVEQAPPGDVNACPMCLRVLAVCARRPTRDAATASAAPVHGDA